MLVGMLFGSFLLLVQGDHQCEVGGGRCMFTKYPCKGRWDSGLCLGPNDRQCCISRLNKDLQLDPDCTNMAGVCQDKVISCWGHHEPGLCSGPPNRICCVKRPDNPFEEKTRPPSSLHVGNIDDEGLKGGDTLDIRWRDICGIPGEHMKTGIDAARGSWPWQTLVFSKTAPDRFCSGALVAPNYVLTSATCMRRFSGSNNLSVRLGENDIYAEDVNEREYDVSRIFVHGQFGKFDQIQHNLALLKLMNETVDLNSQQINTVCMPTPDQTFTESKCWILSWRPNNEKTSGMMKQTEVTPLSPQLCRRQIWGFNEGMICTTNRKQVACLSNSGSPLVCEKNGRYFLAGVAAFTEHNCGVQESAIVFSRVPFYLDWFYTKTRSSYVNGSR